MTKKHFISLADKLKVLEIDKISPEIIDALCAWMREQNPYFNRSRWLSYLSGECGPNGGKVK